MNGPSCNLLRGIVVGVGLSLLPVSPLTAADLPEISFSRTSYSTNEGKDAKVIVKKKTAGEAEIRYESYPTGDPPATAGSDYQSVSGSLYFSPTDTEKTITVTTYADSDVDEQTETFGMRLLQGTGGDGQATANLVYPVASAVVILNCATPC